MAEITKEKAAALTLIQISDQRHALMELVQGEDGEITEGPIGDILMEWWDEISKDLKNKADKYGFLNKTLNDIAEECRDRASLLSSAARAFENQSDALKERMKLAMSSMEMDKIETSYFRFTTYESSLKCVVVNKDQVPANFSRETVLIEVDKDAAKKAYKETGEQIPGLSFETGTALRIKAMGETKPARPKISVVKDKKVKAIKEVTND